MPKNIDEVNSIEELEEILHASKEELAENPVDDTPENSESVNSEDTSETHEDQETHRPSDEDIRSLVASIPLDTLMQIHPGISGKVGATAQKLANDLAARQVAETRRREQEEADQAEVDELLRLAQEDPEAAARGFTERTVRQRSQKQSLELDEATRKQYGQFLSSEMDEIYRTPIMNQFANVMTDEQLASLYWKNGRYQGFASWAQGMLETVYEFAKEEGRKEAASVTQSQQNQNPNAPTRQSNNPARRETASFSSNLGDGIEPREGAYRPGDVDKMDFGTYARNRNEILKSIWKDE